MTVNTEGIVSGPYVGNDLADTFSYTFRIEDKTQLEVYQTIDDGAQTILMVDTDYTVNEVGLDAGGTITRIAGPLPTGYKWWFRANYKQTQLTPFASQGGFFPDIHEMAIDKLTFLSQQLQEETDRSIKVQVTSDIDPDELITAIFEAEQNASDSADASEVSNQASAASASASEVSNQSAQAVLPLVITEGNTQVARVITEGDTQVARVIDIVDDYPDASEIAKQTSPTGAFITPSGTTAERPLTPQVGYFRYNTTLGYKEEWDGTDWVEFSGGGGGGTPEPKLPIPTADLSITTGEYNNLLDTTAGQIEATILIPSPVAGQLVFIGHYLEFPSNSINVLCSDLIEGSTSHEIRDGCRVFEYIDATIGYRVVDGIKADIFSLDGVEILPVGNYGAGTYTIPTDDLWTNFEYIEIGGCNSGTPNLIEETMTISKELINANPLTWRSLISSWVTWSIYVTATGANTFTLDNIYGPANIKYIKGYKKKFATRSAEKIIYVNGGANIGVSYSEDIDIATALGTEYLDKDLKILCEIYHEGKWADPKFIYAVGGFGVGASLIKSTNYIVVSAGSGGLTANQRNYSGSTFDTGTTSAPCRLTVSIVGDELRPATKSSGGMELIIADPTGWTTGDTIDISGTNKLFGSYDMLYFEGVLTNGRLVFGTASPQTLIENSNVEAEYLHTNESGSTYYGRLTGMTSTSVLLGNGDIILKAIYGINYN